ncbi:MAG: GNAT family N-acetyltransferase [Rhodobacteraceae bacterium]|nr:GNAT family N-acetyltransferase [Alphaproteobacteria bacterium]NNK65174.1 GNAT family N-acetyltransferase [Paracoccaceae bacterium]
MSSLRIINAPKDIKPHVIAGSHATFLEHQDRAPFAFPNNAHELLIEPEIHAAFRDARGKDLSESPVIFAAYRGDDLAGYVRLSDHARHDPAPNSSVSIEDIYVLPAFRQTGVARALLDHVRALADIRDWDNLSATVWAGNDGSDRLFAQAGFAPQATRYRYGPARIAKDYPVPPKPPLPLWIWSALGAALILGAGTLAAFVGR